MCRPMGRSMIDGTKAVRVQLVFAVPPGVPPEQVMQMIASNGVSVALGLGGYLRTVTSEVIEFAPSLGGM